MSYSVEQLLSFFRYLIQTKSFGDATLRFLELLLVSKDVKSLVEVRSSLTHLLKSESLSVIRSISAETFQEKLLILDFFVRAFALVGDLEACENALSCLGNNDVQKPGRDSENLKATISEITRLRNCAMTTVSSRSVQVQAAEYLKRKTEERQNLDLHYKEKRCLASTSFRNGIKRQNMRKLYERQSLLQVNGELDGRHPNLS